jgi:hypothetical protein
MGNPILELLGKAQNNPAMQGISQMAGMVQAAQNPQAAVSQMAQNNPQMQQVMQYVQQNGGDAKAAFYALAKQKGIDPNLIIKQVQGMMK